MQLHPRGGVGMELFSWQEECLDTWENNHYRGILHVITGAGKTVAALAAIKRLESRLSSATPPIPLRVKVIVPTTALADQWALAVRSFFADSDSPHEVGVYYGTRKDSGDLFCMIYVVNSARYKLSSVILDDMQKGNHIFLICDECHHYGSAENRKIFSFMQNRRFRKAQFSSLGLSATPQSTYYDQVLVPSLGVEIFSYNVQRALEENRISPYVIYPVSLSLTGEESQEYAELTNRIIRLYRILMNAYPELKGLPSSILMPRLRMLAEELDDPESYPQQYLTALYNRRNIVVMAQNRAVCAACLIRKLSRHERIILFCEKIAQAEMIYNAISPYYPSLSAQYHSELPNKVRDRVLHDFRDGIIRILVACKALDEGVDVPDASVGIIVSSTVTSRQRIQRLGRILRKSEGKDKAALYYFYIPAVNEDRNYLPDENSAESEIIPLSFFSEEKDFDCEPYASVVLRLLSGIDLRGLSKPERLEFNRCLSEGLVRSDWLKSPESLDRAIGASTDPHIKNYFTLMKRLSKLQSTEISNSSPSPLYDSEQNNDPSLLPDFLQRDLFPDEDREDSEEFEEGFEYEVVGDDFSDEENEDSVEEGFEYEVIRDDPSDDEETDDSEESYSNPDDFSDFFVL